MSPVDGESVVLVEDVLNTGKSVLKAVEAVRAVGGKVSAVVAVVDRGNGAQKLLATESIPYYAVYALEDFKS